MNMADVELLFGVQGGSSISTGSGAEIKKDIDGIVKQLNADPFKLKFQVDQTSVTKLRTDLVKLRKEMADTIQQLG